jgi:hypothetical protein
MTDITPEQGAELGTDAMTLILNLMQRNQADNEAIRASLYDSVQHNLDEARAETLRIRNNIQITLHRPHTDFMIADALYASYDYEDPEARA